MPPGTSSLTDSRPAGAVGEDGRKSRQIRPSGVAPVSGRGLRLALVAPSLDILGGQGVQAHALAQALAAAGHHICFIPINPRFPGGLQRLRRYPYIRTILNEALFLPSLLRAHSADVMHVFSASYWSFLMGPVAAILAGRMLGKRLVLNYHSGEAADHLARWGPLVHPWLRLVNQIVVPSEYLRETFARHGYSARVIHNVVDTARFRYRERVPLHPRLLSTRNLEPYYRIDITLRAFALLKQQYPEASLTIAGYGSLEVELRRLAASLGADGVRFVGRVEHAEVPRLYDEADIFVNSSTVDNQPLSVLEAFAAGLPVVSTGTGDIRNMLREGENGVLIPPEDPAAMAAAIAALVREPGRAVMLACRARQELEKHTWARVCDEWAAVYTRGAA